MQPNYSKLMENLQSSSQIINGLNAAMNSDAIGQIGVSVNQLIQQVAGIEKSNGTTMTEVANTISKNHIQQTRDQIVQLRIQLNEASTIADGLQSSEAEVYRQAAGAEKEKFETLTRSQQENSNPEAFRHKENFQSLVTLKDLLAAANGDLMDISTTLEDNILKQQHTPDIKLNDVYDHDPAPPTLSP